MAAIVGIRNLPKLLGDPDHIGANMEAYIAAFPPVVRDIFERFGFDVTLLHGPPAQRLG